jgi:hypothetical protein
MAAEGEEGILTVIEAIHREADKDQAQYKLMNEARIIRLYWSLSSLELDQLY